MGQEIVVNQENFAEAVIAASHENVVLVDFFATWCGPCQILKPKLEALAKEYDFTLAKIDIDENSDLASEYGVEGVPDVRIVTNGKVIPGFVGVLEDHKIRELLDNLKVESKLNELIGELKAAQEEQNPVKAKEMIDRLFQQYPNHPKVTIAAAEFLIFLGKLEQATRLLNTIPADQTEYFTIAGNIRGQILLRGIAILPVESDLDQKYVGAAKNALVGNYESALTSLLEIVAGDRKYQDDGARKVMLVIFNLLGKNHPLTQKFQQQLMLTLY